jgi:hypothetical protein
MTRPWRRQAACPVKAGGPKDTAAVAPAVPSISALSPQIRLDLIGDGSASFFPALPYGMEFQKRPSFRPHSSPRAARLLASRLSLRRRLAL